MPIIVCLASGYISSIDIKLDFSKGQHGISFINIQCAHSFRVYWPFYQLPTPLVMSSTLRAFIRFECFVYSVLSRNYSCCANKQHTRSNSPASNSSGCQYLVLFGKKWALSPIAHGARNLIDNKFRLPFTCKNYEFITAVGQNHGKLCSLVILQYILFKKKNGRRRILHFDGVS